MVTSQRPSSEVVQVGGTEIAFDDALTVIAGYCLGEEAGPWTAPLAGVGDGPGEFRRGAFAYRTYDCIPAASTTTLEAIDVLVADGLNAEMRAKDIAGVLAVAHQLAAELARIDELGITFWDLTREDLIVPPTRATNPAWPLWRSWTILMGVEGIDIARTHKILHHKRPRVFPLIDNETVRWLNSGGSAWASIHDDLTITSVDWSKLENTVADLLGDSGPVLTRLRLHDILLWTRATGRWAAAHGFGLEARGSL